MSDVPVPEPEPVTELPVAEAESSPTFPVEGRKRRPLRTRATAEGRTKEAREARWQGDAVRQDRTTLAVRLRSVARKVRSDVDATEAERDYAVHVLESIITTIIEGD